MILFSTLLAPRHAIGESNDQRSEDEDLLEALEELREDEDDESGEANFGESESEDEDEGPAKKYRGGDKSVFKARVRKAAPVRALGLSYSTLAHFHGERLLNV